VASVTPNPGRNSCIVQLHVPGQGTTERIQMKKLKDVIYLKSDAIVLNKDQIDPFENLIGDINDQLEKKGISLCYCYDKLKNNKAKIHGWDLRPKPQASSSKHQA